MRESASWYIGCSRITELPSGERDEDVVERGVMRGEQRQLHTALAKQREQRGEGAVQLYDRERDSVGTRPHRRHTPHLSQDLDQIVRNPALRQREVHHVVRAQRRNQLLGSSLGDDLAVIHDRDAIAEALGFLHIVRREQHRPAVRTEAADDFPQLPARLRIQAGRRLIEEQQLGFADERARDGEALLLTARERHDARLALFLQLDEGEHFIDGVRLPVERSEQREDLADLQLVGELGFLELNAEALAQRPPGGAVAPRRPQDLDLARVRYRQALEDFNGGGLAGAVGAEQPKTLARADGEVEARDRHDVPEALLKRATVDRYDWFFSVSFSG